MLIYLHLLCAMHHLCVCVPYVCVVYLAMAEQVKESGRAMWTVKPRRAYRWCSKQEQFFCSMRWTWKKKRIISIIAKHVLTWCDRVFVRYFFSFKHVSLEYFGWFSSAERTVANASNTHKHTNGRTDNHSQTQPYMDCNLQQQQTAATVAGCICGHTQSVCMMHTRQTRCLWTFVRCVGCVFRPLWDAPTFSYHRANDVSQC